MITMKMSEPIAAAGATGWGWKAAGGAIGGWAMSFIAPIQPFLITIAVLVLCDVITGVWAAYKVGEPISAARLARTVPKVILYPAAVMISQLMVKTFFDGTAVVEGLTYMVALFISTVEFQSNIENIGKITGMDLWSQLKTIVIDRVRGVGHKKQHGEHQ